ncbi:MAG TPA: ABC transporter ATP-binding protein [Terriglobia bacterium]|nr:ABC transporter ATP-binding protein [Terriglobia bacterium]
MTDTAISTQGLTKIYPDVRAVDGLNLNVPRGAVYGFLGRNGAGKTTTIRTLLGLSHPTAGSAQVLGMDIGKDHVAILQRTGFVSETKQLFDSLTPAQLVRFNRSYFPKWSDALVERYVSLFEIPMNRPFAKLSLGNRSKVCHLLALCQGADLLMLDEPTSGLDPVMMDLLLRVLVEDHVSEGRTVFISSHHLSEVERIADWIGIIEGGKLVLETRLEDIRQNFRLITASGESAEAVTAPNLISKKRSDKFHRYLVSREAEDFVSRLHAKGMTILEVSPVNLGEVFLGLAGKELPCIAGSAGTTRAIA